MALSPGDPHSYSRPGYFAVYHTHLELFVDFKRTVLSGKAILTIRRKQRHRNRIILDTYGLTIISVKHMLTGENLEFYIEYGDIFGNKFIINMPKSGNLVNDVIQIKYETSPNSPALYWLTPKQTSDGTHPLLISNSKLTYARAIFPCQDTPSHTFTFSAKISVPMDFNVMMNARKIGTFVESNRLIYHFSQERKIPSYAMVIAAGFLEERIINQSSEHSIILKCHMWAEKKYIQKSKEAFVRIMKMALIVLKLYNNIDELNVCVLPPCMPEFDVQCPYVTFVSSTLLCGDDLMISIILQNILESLTAELFPIKNFEHLWLIKSFSIFIYRTIIDIITDETMKIFLEVKGFDNLMKLHEFAQRMPLTPNLKGILPNNIVKYVLYEKGYLLWDYLRNFLGFEDSKKFIRSIIRCIIKETRRRPTISTETFKDSLRFLFNAKNLTLNSINWNMWFYEVKLPDYNLHTDRTMYCHFLVNEYMTIKQIKELYRLTATVNKISHLEKIEFLSYLHALPTVLPIEKLRILRAAFLNDQMICELWFLWLRLCIKSRWMAMTSQALEFACEYCMPKYACSILRDIYDWTETRHLAILCFETNYKKMLPETVQELKFILQLN